MTTTTHKHFGAFFDKDSKVLILGSFPSADSLKEGFFYQNCRNRFWCVMQKVFDKKGLVGDIDAQKDFLKEQNIALWDIWVECVRKGKGTDSADKNIDETKSKRANLNEILQTSQIRAIFTTIGKGDCFKKWGVREWISSYFPNQNIDEILYPLYSTSARSLKSDDDIVDNYKTIKEKLNEIRSSK